jgi:hypothetical protein
MKSLHLILLLLAPAALAQTPAAPDAAAPLGRLFNTAEQRARLDGMRARNVEPGGTKIETELRLDGIVRTSDGRSTVWVNGEARTDRSAIQSLGEHSARILTSGGRSVELPVGGSIRMVADDAGR